MSANFQRISMFGVLFPVSYPAYVDWSTFSLLAISVCVSP